MLVALYIKNFALIREAEIAFGNGLNVLTGETGSGKSLMLAALGMVLGEKADPALAFDPDKKCVVEARFQVSTIISTEINRIIGREDEEPDPEIVIRREMAQGGRSRSFIQDSPVALPLLRDAASLLVEFHHQHEHQRLFQPDYQLDIVDQFAGNQSTLNLWRRQLEQARKIRDELEAMRRGENEARQLTDFLQFQAEELTSANVQPGEEQALEQELKLLSEAGTISALLQQAQESWYNQERSLYTILYQDFKALQKYQALHPTISEWVPRLQEACDTLKSASREFGDLAEQLGADQSRMGQVESRLGELQRLKTKYSVRSADLLPGLLEDIQTRLRSAGNISDRISDAEIAFQQASVALAETGEILHAARKQAIPGLESEIQTLFNELNLQGAEIRFILQPVQGNTPWLASRGEMHVPTGNGWDTVQILVKLNPGTPSATLKDAASGGETSRLLLAIKAVMAKRMDLPVIIFDEIDTGISGETARKVGALMRKMAEDHCVIAITHLPQIAACGNLHLKVQKEISGGSTTTQVLALDYEGRILEIAGMIAGNQPGKAALEHAKDLLRQSAGIPG